MEYKSKLDLVQEALNKNGLGKFKLEQTRGKNGALQVKITETGVSKIEYINYPQNRKDTSFIFMYLYQRLFKNPNEQEAVEKAKSDLEKIKQERTEAVRQEKRVAEEIQNKKYMNEDQLKEQAVNNLNKTIYIVGIRRKTKIVRLAAYRGKDLKNNRKSGVGLTYQQVLGGYDYEPVFQSSSKEECLKYIKHTFDGSWGYFDHSHEVKKLNPGVKTYAVIGDIAAGEYRIGAYHSGNLYTKLTWGHETVMYESTRIEDCRRFIKEYKKAWGN